MAWLPFELHPEVPPEGMALPTYLSSGFANMKARLQEMAQEVGMEIVLSADRIPNSRRALEAAEYARENGRHDSFHQILFRRFYGEGEDLGEWEMLRAAAVEVGLDPDEMQRKTESGGYQAVVDEHIETARALGITGVPVYIFDDKYAVVGARPYDVFQEVMDYIVSEADQIASEAQGDS